MAESSNPSSKSKAKARVALRAERAFGLDAVPFSRAKKPPAILPPAPVAASPTPPANPAPHRTSPTKIISPTLPGMPAFASAPSSRDPFTAPIFSAEEKRKRLQVMDEQEVRVCKLCRLCETRTKTVFGEGDANASIVFIGEGPGENEDLSGRPFVGRAGQLLDKMIAAMGLRREQVFIVNIVKCRPPNNRVPAPDEVASCTPYLERQLELIRPRVIVTLGLPSAKFMLQSNSTMGKLRGNWVSYRGIKLMPTFHPAYILRSYTKETREAVWSDLQMVMQEIGLPTPKNAREGGA